MPTSTSTTVLLVCVLSVMCCDAGILPTFPGFSLPGLPLPKISLPNPFDGARGWYFPDFKDVWEFWSDLPRQASNLLTKLVPRPIKDFLNFDPAPNWVPDPDNFEEENEDIIREESKHNLTDLTGESSENRASRSRSFNVTLDDDEDREDKNFIPYEERGNLHGIGREVIKSLSNTIGSTIGNLTNQIGSTIGNITNTIGITTNGLDTDKNLVGLVMNDFKDRIKAIYPGTQWCGDGNVARTRKNLGFFRRTDNCCREHDNCPDFIGKDELKYGLYNNGLFTRSNCECDQKFYNCLKASSDMISFQIGTAYFTFLGPQCFKKEYPILNCRIQVGLTNRCIEYELDNRTEKIYQWFDNPEF